MQVTGAVPSAEVRCTALRNKIKTRVNAGSINDSGIFAGFLVRCGGIQTRVDFYTNTCSINKSMISLYHRIFVLDSQYKAMTEEGQDIMDHIRLWAE